jgi:hypothetical protein
MSSLHFFWGDNVTGLRLPNVEEPWVLEEYGLYLTLPLVFPPESSGLLESHSSPGKVRYSGCSPGGIQWEASGKPVGSQWEASGNPVGIQ